MENNAIKKTRFLCNWIGKISIGSNFRKKCFEFFGLNYKDFVKVDKNLLRPSKTSNLKANFSKAKKHFGFYPKTSIDKLIRIMIEEELKNLICIFL